MTDISMDLVVAALPGYFTIEVDRNGKRGAMMPVIAWKVRRLDVWPVTPRQYMAAHLVVTDGVTHWFACAQELGACEDFDALIARGHDRGLFDG